MKHRTGFLGALLPLVILVAGCDEKKADDAPDAKPMTTASTPAPTPTMTATATASATTTPTAMIEAADAGPKADAGAKAPPAKK